MLAFRPAAGCPEPSQAGRGGRLADADGGRRTADGERPIAVTNAIQVMAATINDAGGVLGRKIEIVSRDDESTPAVGVLRATALVGAGVVVVIEGSNSPVMLAMQPVLSRAGVLDITAISEAAAILSGEGNPMAVRLNSSNSQDGAVIGNYIANIAQAKRIAFLSRNDAYGNGAQASIEAELKRLNWACEKVAEEKFPFARADFRVAMTNVQAAKPELTVAINANEGLGMPATIRQARQSRLPDKLVAAVGTVSLSALPAGTVGAGPPAGRYLPAPPGPAQCHPRHPRHLLDEHRAAARARRAARAAAHRRRQGIARPDPARRRPSGSWSSVTPPPPSTRWPSAWAPPRAAATTTTAARPTCTSTFKWPPWSG